VETLLQWQITSTSNWVRLSPYLVVEFVPMNPDFLTIRAKRGFSLIELLTVLAIIGLLVGMSGPMLSGLMQSGNANRAISGTASVLDLARQYAVTDNTYTWVVFASNPASSSGGGSLYAVILGSKDGSNTADGLTAIDLDTVKMYDLGSPSSNLTVLHKMEVYRGAQLETLAQSPSPVSPVPVGPNNKVSFKFPGSAAEGIGFVNDNPTQQRIVQFSPNGQSRVSTATSQVIELGVQGMKGSILDPKNVAAVQIDEFTGQTRVYRN
jgi:prepilin-type N-terminal cleavage/methylation domain-containing protein